MNDRGRREADASLALDPCALEVGASVNLVYPGPRGERGFPICEHPRCRREAIGPFAYRCVHHFGVVTIEDLDATLDAWLNVRVAAHRARGGADAAVRAIDVPLYLRALRVVRQVEHVLEPWRRSLGAADSRAYELVARAEQLTLEIA